MAGQKFPWLIKWRKLVIRCTILLTIFGVTLSTLHQSSLGSLYLIAPEKLHPLWYSPFMPMFFFVSSMAAGASMVIFEACSRTRACINTWTPPTCARPTAWC